MVHSSKRLFMGYRASTTAMAEASANSSADLLFSYSGPPLVS